MNKTKDFVENIILFVILLVLIQTFVEDLAVLLDWSWSVRKILIFSGFAFDLFFSFEFMIRYFHSLKKEKGLKYMLQERGWIDLIASFPLLFLSSGPAVIALIQGTSYLGAAGMLNILKVVKTVRIARILRLLRLLKVFKKIKFVNSVMAQRHLTRIITTVISSFVISLTAMSFILALVPFNDMEKDFVEKHNVMANTAAALYEEGSSEALQEFDAYSSILILRTQEGTVYTRHDNDYYNTWCGRSYFGYVSTGDMELFYSLKPLYASESANNLLIFVSILSMLIALMVSYSAHFALTVTDPINIMFNGMSDPSYNLEVLIPDDHKEDGVYKLARQYNEEYLPMKDRNNTSRGQNSGLALKMDDIDDLFK